MKNFFLALGLLAAMTLAGCGSASVTDVSATDDRSQFVEVAEVIPDVILEVRYYTTYNFIGTRIEGYEKPIVLLTRQAADSLRLVSDELMAKGYRLKLYDGYRPQCAVDHFVRWGKDVPDTAMRSYFYPNVDKRDLFKLAYIATRSSHTRGSTIDLTLFDMSKGKDVDMGGTFDWFGNESHPDCGGNPATGVYRTNDTITAEQFAARMLLRNTMMSHGFKPYECEWWHFTLVNEPFPDTYFTFPLK